QPNIKMSTLTERIGRRSRGNVVCYSDDAVEERPDELGALQTRPPEAQKQREEPNAYLGAECGQQIGHHQRIRANQRVGGKQAVVDRRLQYELGNLHATS